LAQALWPRFSPSADISLCGFFAMLRPKPQTSAVAQQLQQKDSGGVAGSLQKVAQRLQQAHVASSIQKASGSVVSTRASPWASGSPPAISLAAKAPSTQVTAMAATMQSRQEELKARREKEEIKRLQHQSALGVRKVITRLRKCGTEEFDDLVAELEQAQADNLEAMGPHADVVQAEAETALSSAMERFEQQKTEEAEKEQKALEAKQERERLTEERALKHKEDVERIDVLLLEANQEVEELETKIAEAVDHGNIVEDMSPDDIVEAVEKTEAAIIATKELQKACVTSIKGKRAEVSKVKGKESSQVTSKIIELQKKLTDILQPLEQLPESMKSAKEAAVTKQNKAKEVAARKAKLEKQEQDRKGAFTKHDKDGDGKLNREEVVMFANTEYNFVLEDAVVDKILGKIPGGKSGVAPERFQQLRSLISMEKSMAKVRSEKAENEEKERLRVLEDEKLQHERKEKTAAITAAMGEVDKELSSAEESASNAKEAVKKLDKELVANEIDEAVEETRGAAQAAKSSIDASEEMMKELQAGEGEDEVVHKLRAAELRKRQDHIQTLRTQLGKVNVKVREVQDAIIKKRSTEMETLRLELLPSILAFMRAQGKTASEYFKASVAAGEMTAKEFGTLLESLSGESVPESYRLAKTDDRQVQGLFKHVAADKDGIDEETFVLLMATLYNRVVKNTGLSSEMAINSKMIRKLEIGEVLEILEGPIEEAETGLMKVRAKSVQDAKEGWVTSKGNKGSVYLEPVGTFFACVKETNLGDGSEITAKPIRKIVKGEIAQMLVPEQKDGSGVMRMKVRMLRDSKIGWITTTSNKNNVRFFESC